jgi:hypothetical protein
MDGALVEPDWRPLDLDEVRALLRQFPGYDEPIEILSVSPRPFSAASVVKANGRHVFVKRHHRSVRDKEGLLEEHRFLEHLWTHGADVPRVLAAASGETAIEKDEWTYEVHETPTGIDLYEEAISWTPFRSAGHAHAAGKALARLHKSAQGFAEPARKPRPLVASFSIFAAKDPRAEMNQYLAVRPALEIIFKDAITVTRRWNCSRLFMLNCCRFSRLYRRCGRTMICTRRICFGATHQTTHKLRPSSISAWQIARMRFTILRMRSNETLSSG